MRRMMLSAVVGLILLLPAGTVFADHGEPRSDRACVGAFESHQDPGTVGPTVRVLANVLQPFGLNVVSSFATSCQFPSD